MNYFVLRTGAKGTLGITMLKKENRAANVFRCGGAEERFSLTATVIN